MKLSVLAIFLFLNFVALAIGGLATGPGVSSDWYASLNKAPWTPPGWVFGAAWTTIMICFSIFMAFLYQLSAQKSQIIALFAVQWLLNVTWNPVFFNYHWLLIALILISLLTILVGVFLFGFKNKMDSKAWFMLPYFLWLLIATSLNAYALLYN